MHVLRDKSQLTEDRRYTSQTHIWKQLIAKLNIEYYSEMSFDNCLFRAEEDRRWENVHVYGGKN